MKGNTRASSFNSHHVPTLEVILENVLVEHRSGSHLPLHFARIHTDAVLLAQSAMSSAAVDSSTPVVHGGQLGGVMAMDAEGHVNERPEGTCMELALEGERLCKSGDCRTGVQFFEAAVQVGTDDLKTLSAIYSQLGNAYFYLQEYGRALEYHKHDLNLARTIGDRLGEAKASGNLGNTLKVLGKFSEAIACCQRHLDISKDLSDRIGEARALYNLGNVYHAKGKHAGRGGNQDPGDYPADVKQSLQKASQYYEQNLAIVRELGDRAAQGRACGNLGNTHYLLGNFSTAISFHEERLAIAREFGDKSAERRAYNNLGNAHIFLGEFEVAAEHYKKTLHLAKQLGDRALEAQACYSLGNTYTLLKDYGRAIEFHIEHLKIAQELRDRVGEGRACWSLGNAHASLGNHEKALQYATKHLEISREIGDQTGQITAQMNLSDLRTILGLPASVDAPDSQSVQESVVSETEIELDVLNKRPARFRRLSMEHMELVRITPDKTNGLAKGARPRPPKLQKAATMGSSLTERMLGIKRSETADNSASVVDDDSFFDLLSRFQSRRIDDQRCSISAMGASGGRRGVDKRHAHILPTATRGLHNKENTTPPERRGLYHNGRVPASRSTTHVTNSTIEQDPHTSDFFDMVAGIQGSRMNDQRAQLPNFPGLNNQEAVIGPLVNHTTTRSRGAGTLDDQFFEMLMRCQSSRIEDQRSTLQPEPAPPTAPTVPDEDFFSLIQRVQSNRLDEQRSAMPAPLPSKNNAVGAANNNSVGGANARRQPMGDELSLNSMTSSVQSSKRGSKKKDKKDKRH